MVPRRAFWWAVAAAVAACAERERITFPTENPGDGQGPITVISHPASRDTTVISGDQLIVEGRTYDLDGVDSIYVNVTGANQGFLPLLGQGRDTVVFGLPLSTISIPGATVTLEVYAVDLLGDRGNIVSRQIHIK
jgi:hypothetical protein